MARYIDADKLKAQDTEEFMLYINEDRIIPEYGLALARTMHKRTQILINNAPTVNVHIERHGHWVICSDGYYPYCSECTKEPQGGVMTDWCPNCGCRMDEEEKR